METTNPTANQSTIALVLLHQYVDSETYHDLDARRQALIQEAIESLTVFEKSGPAWPRPAASTQTRNGTSVPSAEHDTPTQDRAERILRDGSRARDAPHLTTPDDESNRAVQSDDIITDFRVS